MKKSIACLAIALALSSCATLEKNEKNDQENRAKLLQTVKEIATYKDANVSRERDTAVYLKNQWVSLSPIEVKSDPVPPSVKCNIKKLATNEPVTILEFGQIITKECGIPVRVTPDALTAIESPTGGQQSSSPSQPAPGMPNGSSAGSGNYSRLVDINYSGNLSGLMDMVTARFGLSWKYADGYLKIYNLDTETFYLSAIASSTSMQSDVVSGMTTGGGASGGSSGGSGTGGVSGSGSSSQSTSVTLKTSIWDDVKKTLDNMVSSRGKCSVSPSTGAIVCSDNADSLGRIRNYIENENINLTKQVLFRIRVVSVTLFDTHSFGISWSAVYQALAQKYGLALTNTFAAPTTSMAATFSILPDTGSRWAGTDFIVNALAEQGTVSIVKEPMVSTLNLHAVPVQIAKQDGYVPGSQTTTTANVGTTTTLQTGTITTGFNMNLLPYVLPDNRMLLQFSINLSSLRNIRKITAAGGAYAEVPELDLPINSSQMVKLKRGETLMLSGFDQEDKSSDSTGTTSAKNFLLGGGVSAGNNKSTLLVLITPVIMD